MLPCLYRLLTDYTCFCVSTKFEIETKRLKCDFICTFVSLDCNFESLECNFVSLECNFVRLNCNFVGLHCSYVTQSILSWELLKL